MAIPNETAFKQYIENNIRFLLYLKDGISEECPVLPLHIYIEPTNACNLQCPFCFEDKSRTPQFMEFEVYRGLIEDIKKLGWHPRVTMIGNGEPLMNKGIVDMLQLAKDAGLHVSMLSNATLCTEAMSRSIVATKIDRMQFSMDSVVPEIYDQLRVAKKKGHSYFRTAMHNILTFLKLNCELGKPAFVSISSLQCRLNRDIAEDFKAFWNRLPVDNVFLQPLLTLQANSTFPEAVAEQYQGEMKDKPVCTIPWTDLTVKADGTALACTLDFNNTYPIGNVAADSVAALWNNARVKKLRRALLDGEVAYFCGIGHDCQHCNSPLTGYGPDDYVREAPQDITRMAVAFLDKGEVDDAKYRNLLAEIEKWNP